MKSFDQNEKRTSPFMITSGIGTKATNSTESIQPAWTTRLAWFYTGAIGKSFLLHTLKHIYYNVNIIVKKSILFTYKHMIKCSKHISNMSFQQLLFKGQWF
jgi:hypothetical protein